MLFNVVNEKDPRIRITILRPSGIAAMTGSAAPPNNRQCPQLYGLERLCRRRQRTPHSAT
jgi:hypothetical protein